MGLEIRDVYKFLVSQPKDSDDEETFCGGTFLEGRVLTLRSCIPGLAEGFLVPLIGQLCLGVENVAPREKRLCFRYRSRSHAGSVHDGRQPAADGQGVMGVQRL